MFTDLDDPTPPELEERLRAGVRTRVRARRRRRMAVGGATGAVVLGVGGLYLRAMEPLRQVTTLELDAADRPQVAAGDPVTVLVLGTDAVDGTDAEVLEGRPPVSLVDSALLVRIDPESGGTRLMSVPRDLQARTADGVATRLAETFAQQGVDGVMQAVRTVVGVPVDHVVVVDFGGFSDAVDALGGIDVRAGVPLRDEMSGLSIEAPGCVRLDGAQALALVRARHLERFVDGVWEVDSSGDLGRMQRQRLLAGIVRSQVAVLDPLTLHDLTAAVADELTVDAGLDLDTMVSILRHALDGQLVSQLLPTEVVTAANGAVQAVPTADAASVTQWFLTGSSAGVSDPSGPSAADADVSACD